MINNLKNKKKKKGFTLIELIIVIAIIAILAVLAIPKFGEVRRDAALKSDIANAKTIANAATSLLAEGKTVTTGEEIKEGETGVIATYLQNPNSPKTNGYDKYVVTVKGENVEVSMTGDEVTEYKLFPVVEEVEADE